MSFKNSDQSIQPITRLKSNLRSLLKAAQKARKMAYAPYSKYQVGCALTDEKGKVFTGCNVENASYPAGVCAERTAIVKMISEGSKKIHHLLLVGSSKEPVLPCGMCRQVIQEFGAECVIVSVNPTGTHFREILFSDLFPFGFTPDKLKK
jgi:cytidine deaminase